MKSMKTGTSSNRDMKLNTETWGRSWAREVGLAMLFAEWAHLISAAKAGGCRQRGANAVPGELYTEQKDTDVNPIRGPPVGKAACSLGRRGTTHHPKTRSTVEAALGREGLMSPGREAAGGLGAKRGVTRPES